MRPPLKCFALRGHSRLRSQSGTSVRSLRKRLTDGVDARCPDFAPAPPAERRELRVFLSSPPYGTSTGLAGRMPLKVVALACDGPQLSERDSRIPELGAEPVAGARVLGSSVSRVPSALETRVREELASEVVEQFRTLAVQTAKLAPTASGQRIVHKQRQRDRRIRVADDCIR